MRLITLRNCTIIMILLLLASFSLPACDKNDSSPAIKVMVIHSYHERWAWDQDIRSGIIEGLSRKGYTKDKDYELKSFYMDTKVTYTTAEQIEERADKAIEIIQEFEPDIVFVNDDNALKYVAVEYDSRYPDTQLPFVFCGINADPEDYSPIASLDVPGGNITGLLERFPYKDAFSMGTRINPSAAKIVLLADSSPSSTFVVNAFKGRYLDAVTDSPLEVIGPFQLSTFAEWKSKVTEYQDKADFLGVMTYQQLRDENGDVVPSSQVVEWTTQNSVLPEIGFLTFHAEDGFLSAAGVSGEGTGIHAGVIGGEILDGTDPGTISIVDPQVVDIVFNLERVKILDMDIPSAELAKAMAVYHSIGSND